MISSTKEEWKEFEEYMTEHYALLIKKEIDDKIIKKIKEQAFDIIEKKEYNK